jgi:hypothetical protein
MKEQLSMKLVSRSIANEPSLGAPASLKGFSELSKELFNWAAHTPRYRL